MAVIAPVPTKESEGVLMLTPACPRARAPVPMVTSSVAAEPLFRLSEPPVDVVLPFSVMEPTEDVVRVTLPLPDTEPVAPTVISPSLVPEFRSTFPPVVDSAAFTLIDPFAPAETAMSPPGVEEETIPPKVMLPLPTVASVFVKDVVLDVLTVAAPVPIVRLPVSTLMEKVEPVPETAPEISLTFTDTAFEPPLNWTRDAAFSVPFPALFAVIAPAVVLLNLMLPADALRAEVAAMLTVRALAAPLL